MKSLNYLMDHTIYQIFKIILINCWKKRKKTVNPSIRIYANKMENTITFKIKTGYYFELLTVETMKLQWNTKSKIIENENSKNVLNSEIIKIILVHCNIVNNNYQQNSRVIHTFLYDISFGELFDNSPKSFIFLKTYQYFHILKYGLLIKILNR